MTMDEILVNVMDNSFNEEGKKIRQTEVIEKIKKEFDVSVSQAAFSDRLKNKNMKVNTAIEILEVLGYEIVVRPKKGNRQEYVVDRGVRERKKKGEGEE